MSLPRHTPLRRSGRLNPVPKKRAKVNAEYSRRRKAFLEAHPLCQVALLEGVEAPFERDALVAFYRMTGESAIPRSTEIHHRRGRGRFLNDESTWLAVCRRNHERIHQYPSWARERGYLL